MPILKNLINLLEKNKIKYEILEHRTVYTAKDKAQTLHLNPKIVVKTVITKSNGHYSLVLIPADKLLDKTKFKKVLNNWLKKQKKKPVKTIDFASEVWMKKKIKGDVGATPPFGILWNLLTFVDASLLRQKSLIINAGDYNFSLKLTPAGFEKAAGQIIKGSFSISP